MSIPLTCKACGKLIGESSGMRFITDFSLDVGCIGRENHPEPKDTLTNKAFGLIRQTKRVYPETGTSSDWGEYVGPKKRFYVWVAIIMMGSGVLINHKWIWWEFGTGFFGDGLKELT